ncbi:DUF4238 domain-containing protein [Undibacterium sp. Di26W]|uniref:DUF4238 domain-containing protein n=1 Tax=Undibacterium sp. Di26W TaxID=3413035 RepID=UPI003BF35E9F
MAEQTTKRCHWVPKAYLKAFASDEKRKKIWRLSNTAGDPELKPIEKVAVSFNLYVPLDPETKKRDDSFERKLGELEQWFSEPIWKLFQTEMIDLGDESIRKLVALLVATMMLRNPRYFEMCKSIHEGIRGMILAAGEIPTSVESKGVIRSVNPASWPSYRDATEEDLKRNWIDSINNATRYATMLMEMRWSVVFSDEPVFITTDAPVTFLHPSHKFRGIKDAETMVAFPISPTRLLYMDRLFHEPGNQYYRLNGDGSKHNLHLWRNALEYMFTHRQPDDVRASMNAEAERQEYAAT